MNPSAPETSQQRGIASDDQRGPQPLAVPARRLDRSSAFRGLQAIKAKSTNRWEPRDLALPHLHQLDPTITVLIRAESGETLWDGLGWD